MSEAVIPGERKFAAWAALLALTVVSLGLWWALLSLLFGLW